MTRRATSSDIALADMFNCSADSRHVIHKIVCDILSRDVMTLQHWEVRVPIPRFSATKSPTTRQKEGRIAMALSGVSCDSKLVRRTLSSGLFFSRILASAEFSPQNTQLRRTLSSAEISALKNTRVYRTFSSPEHCDSWCHEIISAVNSLVQIICWYHKTNCTKYGLVQIVTVSHVIAITIRIMLPQVKVASGCL
jgi:hypothetical protein